MSSRSKQSKQSKSFVFPENKNELPVSKEVLKATGAAAIGGVAGVGVAGAVGGMGLTLLGTAVSIGLAPMIGAGAVVGLAGYGVYRAISSK